MNDNAAFFLLTVRYFWHPRLKPSGRALRKLFEAYRFKQSGQLTSGALETERRS